MAQNSETRIGTRKYIILFFIVFGLVFVRYCYFGLEYFYQLDDYIQYHNYTAYSESIGELIKGLGLLSSRPLAGLADIFVWSQFFDNMLFAVMIISAMYAVSGILLHKLFSKYFGTGLFFFVIYALLPSGFEGAYWISASSRIVVGLFFASLSLCFFDKWCGGGKKSALVLFSVFQLICYCFYEQVIVFSASATLVLMFLNIKTPDNRTWWGLLMLVNAAVYFALTKLASSGVYGARTSFFFPWQDGYFSTLAGPLGNQLKDILLSGTKGIYGKGLLRGLGFLIKIPNILWCLIVIILCSGLFIMSRDDRRYESRFWSQLIAGVFLAATPVLLFFIIESPWFGLRNMVTSFCGFGLIASALLDLLCHRIKRGSTVQAAIVAAVAFLCCVCSVSELYDYRQATLTDTEISKAVYEAVRGINISGDEEIWLLNVETSYVEDSNFYFHEHGYGVTSSSWALTGAVRAISGDGSVPTLVPVPFSGNLSEASGAARIFYYENGVFIPVTLD